MKALAQVVLVLVVLYLTSYIVLRSRWTRRWETDGRLHMEFPTSPAWISPFYRPLCMADERLSGLLFHLGPRPEATP